MIRIFWAPFLLWFLFMVSRLSVFHFENKKKRRYNNSILWLCTDTLVLCIYVLYFYFTIKLYNLLNFIWIDHFRKWFLFHLYLQRIFCCCSMNETNYTQFNDILLLWLGSTSLSSQLWSTFCVFLCIQFFDATFRCFTRQWTLKFYGFHIKGRCK